MCNNLNLCHKDLFIKFHNLRCGMCIQNSVKPVTCNIKCGIITNKLYLMRYEILTAVLMQIQVSLDVKQC
jgi:hypothetical protein